MSVASPPTNVVAVVGEASQLSSSSLRELVILACERLSLETPAIFEPKTIGRNEGFQLVTTSGGRWFAKVQPLDLRAILLYRFLRSIGCGPEEHTFSQSVATVARVVG
ncbi:Hypothetical protein UVM_LOCUS252 [uncultured virus]|nr:Hypothetical protein UVM_LOCUS252 [uncultured virus]